MDSAANFEILDSSAINRLNKEELKVYTLNLSKHFSVIRDAIFAEDGIFGKLTSQLTISANVNSLLLKKLESVERTAQANAQYSRKETFEVHGIPTEVPDEDVEKAVLGIVNELKDSETPEYIAEEIHSCHRLQNPKKVICKMVSRKRMREIIQSRKKLKNTTLKCMQGSIYISESMSPAFSLIDFYSRQLKKKNYIYSCWFFNGSYTVVKVDGGRKHRISHLADLEEVLGMSEADILSICPPRTRGSR